MRRFLAIAKATAQELLDDPLSLLVALSSAALSSPVSKPLSKNTLYEALNLITATHFRLEKMEHKNAKLTAKMEEIRIVNHAKWVLIENLGLTEEEAHKMIEKQAMDTRQTKREVSENILKTYGAPK